MSEDDIATLETVNIRPGVSVLSILRHLNYRPWFAIAEFVDNALQSYLANRTALEAIHGPDFKLLVEVSIETSSPSRISIRDNAAGIAARDFPRAFRPAAIPPDRSGLSEFGMGMKSAACWFAPQWHVRTSALGEPVERLVSFDVQTIVNDQIEALEIREQEAARSDHFTEVVLENLHHIPVGRTLGKMKEHLRDIYRVYIRRGDLRLKFGNELLDYEEPSILRARFVREPEGPEQLWRKPISIDLGDGVTAVGFAGLMDPMNTSRSGFALFRRDRLIEGSGDEGYRPPAIFGQAGSFRWRRLFGELHLEGFEVSHTKDGFRWDEKELPFLEALKSQLDSEELPLLRQADLYRVQVARDELARAANQALNATAEVLREALPDALPLVAEKEPVEATEDPLPPEPLLAGRQITVPFRGETWQIRIELSNDPAQSDWLEVGDQPASEEEPNVIEIRVSMAHPFMVSFAQTNPDDIEALVRLAAGLALSEKLARLSGVKLAKTVRRNLNDLLRHALSQP